MLGATAMLALVAILDLLTPPDVGFAPFYLAPVVVIAWGYGWRAGITVAALAAGTELLVDSGILRAGDDDVTPIVHVWNTSSTFAALAIVAVLVSRFHDEHESLTAVSEERSRLLRLLDREFARPLRAIDWVARTFEEALERQVPVSTRFREQFVSLRHHSRELSFLATDLLRLGRVRAGDLQFSSEPLDLKEVARLAADETVDRNRVVVRFSSEPVGAVGDGEAVRHAVSSIIGRLLDGSPTDVVDLLVRPAGDQSAIEFTARGRVLAEGDLELAELIIHGNGGRIHVASPGPAIRIHMYMRRAEVATPVAVAPNAVS